ncbi:pheromone A receptor-domain-containing protein [Amylostereum chailletii]|nr:pheromone A receptor-domain-containing protein [Amylostereum chailletii]
MDPTYPAVPVVNLLAAFFAFLSLLTSVRQSWNVGLLMLCLWLLSVTLIDGVEGLVWSSDSDNKAPVWCDISSHFDVGVSVGVPACSLAISRRLYNIVCLRTMGAQSNREKRNQLLLDLFIGLGFPVLVMGPFYYIVQSYRFEIIEEVGCGSTLIASGLTVVLVNSWPIVFPLISVVFYCPRILWVFYRHHKDVNDFLSSNASDVDRTKYFRILAVSCFDIFFTLPTGAVVLLQSLLSQKIPFYPGWNVVHHPWGPVSISADEWRSQFWFRFAIIYNQWQYPVLAIVVFALFGLTGEARAAYRCWFWTWAGFFGVRPAVGEDVPSMEFGTVDLRDSMSIPAPSTDDDLATMHSKQENKEHRRVDVRELA